MCEPLVVAVGHVKGGVGKTTLAVNSSLGRSTSHTAYFRSGVAKLSQGGTSNLRLPSNVY